MKYRFAYILVTSLFFLWGLAYGLLDVLNKHFQETLHVGKGDSAFLQMAYFGAYFLVALPAGLFMTRFGYKRGIISGLLLYALGAFLFYPAAQMASFPFFLFALFILASGLTFLETAANPYVTVLGNPESSEMRLNLSQSFNGVGSFLGPIIAAKLFFSSGTSSAEGLDSVKFVYFVIGAVVLAIAGMFWRTPLPEIQETRDEATAKTAEKPLFKNRHFVNAVVAQFFYVAGQVCIAAFFLNYIAENAHQFTTEQGSYLLSVSLFLFTVGRFAGTALMRTIEPHKLLVLYALITLALCLVVVSGLGAVSVYALMAIFFFESIMFPTIFALGVKGLGAQTKRASSFIIMSIVGGALVPYIMGKVADHTTTAHSYLIPAACFVVVAWFGWKGWKEK